MWPPAHARAHLTLRRLPSGTSLVDVLLRPSAANASPPSGLMTAEAVRWCERYAQVQGAPSDEVDGTGMNLSQVRACMRACVPGAGGGGGMYGARGGALQ